MTRRMHSSISPIQINRASRRHSRISPSHKSRIKSGTSLLWIMVLDVSTSHQTRVSINIKNLLDTCIGYNTLYVIPTLSQPNGQDLPDGKRLWTWLIQCDDGEHPIFRISSAAANLFAGTIISIQENPFPRRKAVPIDEAKPVLDIVRRNIRFIFAGVSRQHFAMSESESLITIRVRHFSDLGPDQANIKQKDGPSLLFYYIFDDWVSSYGLIAKREHKYGVALEKLVSSVGKARLC